MSESNPNLKSVHHSPCALILAFDIAPSLWNEVAMITRNMFLAVVFLAAASCVEPYSPTEQEPAQPEVVEVIPEDGATGVPVSTQITVKFSKPLRPESVNTYSLLLLLGGQVVSGALEYDSEETSAVFSPEQNLREGATYRLHVTRRITDTDGLPLNTNGKDSMLVTTFTTEATAPEVISTEPADGAADVPLNIEEIEVRFSEPMDPASLNEQNIVLYDTVVDLSYDEGTNTLTLAPQAPLAPLRSYRVTVTKGVTDRSGIPIETQFSFEFKTAGQ